MSESDEEFELEDLGIEIHCPDCGNEMVNDGDSLTLAESPRATMLECGNCHKISQWEFSGDPIQIKQVPVTWGENL